MSLRSQVALFAVSFAFWGAGVAGADPFVDLSALSGGGAGYPYGAADGINDSGQVVGSMSIGGVYTRFSYTSGTVYDLNSQLETPARP